MDGIGWKLASAGAMAAAAFGAGKVAEVGWKLVTGRDVPHEDDDEVALVSLVIFAAASAAIIAVAQRYVVQSAKKVYATHALPQISA